jgi:hypothetical protein
VADRSPWTAGVRKVIIASHRFYSPAEIAAQPMISVG